MLATCVTPTVLAQTQTDVAGFESTQYWSTTSGTLASTTVHSQGNAALAVSNFSYTELQSIPLSTLSGVSKELAVDVQLPALFAWGQVQVSVTSPTLGLYNAWVGAADLANLSTNKFHKLTFAVPANIETALKQNYSDLVIKLVLNVPNNTSAIVIDNLRFSGQTVTECTSSFNLITSVEGEFNNETLNNLICTFHKVYPQLVARFNPNAPTTVYLETRDINDPAGVNGNHLAVQRQWMLDRPDDTDIMVHEGMHIVQSYTAPNLLGWITEGIADYVRNEFGLSKVFWLQNYRYGQHYTNGYGVAGSFLKWIDENYAGGGSSRIDQVDKLMRSGLYTNSIWVQWTGLDVDHLWHLYSVEKGALFNEQPAPLPATNGAFIYEHGDYNGNGFRLDVGDYTPIDLMAYGASDSWFDPSKQDSGVSSLKVPAGYRVTLFMSDNLTGPSVQYTSDSSFIGTWNDKVHSIRVELIQ
ncbi:MAG: basic secretory protein-like protein [Pseudomonadota bacterium]